MLDKTEKSPHERIDDWAFEVTGGVVQSGPFEGIKILRDQSWSPGSLAPIMFGCHEAELHDVIEQEITRLNKLDTPRIANIGCAEGYYAVGLAQRVPKADVFAVDIVEDAVRITNDTATANGVKITTGKDMTVVFAAPDLIVMDCEGAEVLYLDLDEFPALAKATVIAEMHNEKGYAIILERFRPTHTINIIIEGGRNPNIYPALRDKPSDFRWMVMSEGRPCCMFWLVMRPK